MEGTAERLLIGREDIVVLCTDARCYIDKIEAGAGGEGQENFSGLRRHRVSPGWLRYNILPYLPPRSRRGMMGTGRYVCDKDCAVVAGSLGIGILTCW